MGDDLEIADGLVIPERELSLRFSTSGGPGGQHANRSATRVELSFDIAASAALDGKEKARLLERLGSRLTGTEIVVVADDTRSQWRNRSIARRRLAELLRDAQKERRRRLPSRPTRASKVRRIERKRARSEIKKMRRKPDLD